MYKKIGMLVITLLFLFTFSRSTAFAQTRKDLPNDFGIELGGKSLIYTFSYQRTVQSLLGLEAGFSALGGGSSSDNTSIIFFPVGAKFYFLPKDASPFIAGGAVLVTASVKSGPFDDSASNTYGFAGLGFEYRSTSGILFRGTAYGLISGGSFFIWPGLHVGYAF
jgi:hypothetical protein